MIEKMNGKNVKGRKEEEGRKHATLSLHFLDHFFFPFLILLPPSLSVSCCKILFIVGLKMVVITYNSIAIYGISGEKD